MLLFTTAQSSTLKMFTEKSCLSALLDCFSRLTPTPIDLESEVDEEEALMRSKCCHKSLRILQRIAPLLGEKPCPLDGFLLDLMRVLVSSPRSLSWFPATVAAADVTEVTTYAAFLELE